MNELEHAFKVNIRGWNEKKNKEYVYEKLHLNLNLAVRDITTFKRSNIVPLEYKITREVKML